MSYNARRNGGFNNQHFCQQVGNIGQRRPSIGRPPIANNFVLGGQLKVPSKPVVVNQQDATQQQTGAQNAQGQHQQANAVNFKNEGQTPQQQTITSPKVKLEQQIQEVQQPQHQEAAQLQQQQQTVQIQQDAQQQQQNEQLQQQQTEQLKEQAEQIQQQKQATQLQQEAAQLQVPQTIQIQHKTAQCQQQPAQLQQEAAQLQEQETTQIQQHQTTERQEQQAVQLQQQAVQLQQQQAIQLQQQQAVQLQQQQATRPQHQQATRPQQQQATRTHQQQAAKLQQEAAKLKQEAVYLQQEAAQLQQMQVAQLRQQRAAQFQRQQAARFQQKQAAQFQQQQAAQLRQQKQQVVQFQQQQQSAQLQQQAAQLQLHIEQQLAKLADSAVCIKPDGKVLKKPFWSKGPVGSSVASGKVSRRERVRRRNFKLSRMLHPKNAVMILNELVKNASYMLEELPSKFDDNQFKATVFYDGIEHTGYGRDKIHAKNTAAEAALKHLIKPSRLAEIKKDEDGNEEMDLIEGDPNQPPLPWQHVASFALYKLFSSWGEDSSTAQGESQNFATINNSDNRPSKKMPENPANINPLMLINQMLPQANFEEIGKTGNPPTVTFSFRCNVDGQSFIGTGPNKKAAKRMAAFGACSKILGITYPPEIYVPIY